MSQISGKEMFERLFNLKHIEEDELMEYFLMNNMSKEEESILENIQNRPEDSEVNLSGLNEKVFYEVIRNIESHTDSNYIFDERLDYFPDYAYDCLLKFMFDTKTQLGCIIETQASEIVYFDARKSIERYFDEQIKDWEDAASN